MPTRDTGADDLGRECEPMTTGPTCSPVPCCARVMSVRPLLHYALDGDLENRGEVPGYAGTSTGGTRFIAGALGGAVSLQLDGEVSFPGTRELLDVAPQLVFSLWMRTDGEGRAGLACRSWGHGFETYAGVTHDLATCAGDGYGPPRAWGACATVPACTAPEWTHVVLRWMGPGTEPEVSSDGIEWRALTATMGFPVDRYDLFAYALDLSLGLAVGDESLARGTIDVDDVRVYDSPIPDDEIWAVTSCPAP